MQRGIYCVACLFNYQIIEFNNNEKIHETDIHMKKMLRQ